MHLCSFLQKNPWKIHSTPRQNNERRKFIDYSDVITDEQVDNYKEMPDELPQICSNVGFNSLGSYTTTNMYKSRREPWRKSSAEQWKKPKVEYII